MACLTLGLLNVFVLATGVVALDVIESRPGETAPYPVARAEEGPAPAAADAGAEAVGPDRLADILDDPMSRSDISEGLFAYVADAQTHQELYARQGTKGAVPASTTKVVTAVAVLHSPGPDTHITTRVVRGEDPDEVVLVGGGDPTLTRKDDGERYPRLATLEDLARQTAASLDEEGIDAVRLDYDDSTYPGSALGPGWKKNYVPEGSTGAVHALMIDEGRVEPDSSSRVENPPLVAAEAFAKELESAGITVTGGLSEVTAPEEPDVLGSVDSPPVSALVEMMMLTSDNNIAEALARQIALAQGEELTFEGAVAATDTVLAELGIEGVDISDNSGLSTRNRISPQALVELLLLAADPDRPDLYYTLSGLPTAHFSGSLRSRYSPSGPAEAGAGLVRAKTGTLNGVSALAGTAYNAEGRLVVFAFVANHSGASGYILDTLAAVLV
ncbi:D-alanyl-D-alanine carboxypeptidase/D-alanyl-D-alanine endopeptidase [Nocardiopsis ansamitocini]|uniref:D-alanyl-D-alanine carboxypeptidase/D-alanyl-D-alanine endopeptidase n=1 Tax=Nocardiopsis ansamitocini TaxID=1670832 RepID=UPI002555E8E5|nr:D-alanyl-D-alanine carboxypeptidase/D-alanyl-D-alanine-endopeptidase [Nocardiopsis ansamitocini]